MKMIAFHNLGCKVNSYELDLMQQTLQKDGWEIVDFDQKADVYVINTCSVTNIADRKSRQMIHRAKTLNPDAVIAAVGCYVQADAFNLAQDNTVDLLVGNNKKADFHLILQEYLEAKIAGTLEDYAKRTLGQSAKDGALELVGQIENDGPDISGTEFEVRNYLIKTLGNTTIVDLKKVPFEKGSITHTDSHTRAYIKIQDGCNRYCSYCIIPYTRGNVRSKPIEEVLEEARIIVGNGVRELVLTGIHISSYGVDFKTGTPGEHLLTLLSGLDAIRGLDRIRLSSFEPMLITEEFAEGLGKIKKLCPHFHLSLQSGCDETLKRMNRRYTSEEYAEKVKLLRRVFPDAAITTDIIVGFPQETEKEFKETVQFAEAIGFYEIHVFKYSRRKGTPADRNPDQVPEQVKGVRSDTLLELTASQSKAFRQRRISKETEVLFEEEKTIDGKPYWVGHTKEYVLVAVRSLEPLENRIMRVIPQGFLTDEILLADGVESGL